MAKLPQLISAIADCDERPHKTIEWIARVAREGGELPTTKRGGGASDMTFADAARLLIAVSVAEAAPKEAALVVPKYWSLVGQNYSSNKIDGGVFARIDEAKTFGQALAALIEGAPELLLSFHQYIDKAYSNHTDDQRKLMKKHLLSGDYAAVKVMFNRPVPYAEIQIVAYPAGKTVVQYEWKFRMDPELMAGGHYNIPASDASTQRTIGLKTLMALFSAIYDDEDESGDAD